MEEIYYPTLKEILDYLGEDCILVGSATTKEPVLCKDYDFVIGPDGWKKLLSYDYYLFEESKNWRVYIPYEHDVGKQVDFFYGICDIMDTSKYDNRITFDQASLHTLKLVDIEGSTVLSI